MSDPNEPPRPEGPSDQPGAGATPPPPGGDAPVPPPPPPSESPYGEAAGGAPNYGAPNDGAPNDGASGYGDGGSGAPPPPPSGSPYGVPEPPAYSATEAIGFGWRHFFARPAALLVPTLVIGVLVILLSYVVRRVFVDGMTDSDSSLGAVLVAAALSSAISGLITQILAAGLYKGGVAVADGRSFSFGELFEGWDKVQVIVAAVIIGVLTLIGTILCYFPALIAGYFTQFTILFIVDKHMSATEALRASFRLCMDNLGATILFYLLAIVTIIVGAILCLVGLLVAVPIVLVGLAYTYRRLQGEPVVNPAPKTA